MRTRIFFNDENNPIVVHEKNNKQALFDTRKNKYITKFNEQIFDRTEYNPPGEWYSETDGKIFIAESNKTNVLFVDYEPVLKFTDGTQISFFTMKPNENYVVLQKDGEWLYNIKKKKQITSKFATLYPAINFPKQPFYKAVDKQDKRKEAIYIYPENKKITPSSDLISSIAEGAFIGVNKFYWTVNNEEQYYWMKWNIPILHKYPKIAYKIFKDLDLRKKITLKDVIKRAFEI